MIKKRPSPLEFEAEIAALEERIEQLEHWTEDALEGEENTEIEEQVSKLKAKAVEMRVRLFSNLSRWQKVLVARHRDRPYTLDYINLMTEDFVELHGDRLCADDPAMVCGFARFRGRPVAIVGQQKGRTIEEKLDRNWGMAGPEGYRKALRIMKLAEKYHMPIISLVDTPGAAPGVSAEEHGQAEAIARNLFEMARLRTSIVIVVIGEGASGGALGIGVGDRALMMENCWYSVISPEGCAQILWRTSDAKEDAAQAMRISAADLEELGLIDEVVQEPMGGAHRSPEGAADLLGTALDHHIQEITAMPLDNLLAARRKKLYQFGIWGE
jgi:acetyl-CoA carboxylase carboxyl transferase subunit alpha